ncbi:MAG: ABC transporter permease [Sporocytophaga sp.]|jgi:phospholipid/cholesterol/gamma-HCH transport system permease protein|uniref:MlaE family ABC transporter permease n=1 Tax=Sporocytophaga myxococcoides TaxID=153721 RepID=UPI0004243E5B|nr:ABC transporter permease [Sporocytophaga myxococcoides]MCR6640788.1 ABC transporter permease [Sporocytophaga sp.]
MKSFGKYLILLSTLLVNRERFNVYVKRIVDEAILIGIDSVFIVVIVSTFIGAVTAVQTAYNLVSPLIPLYIIGTIVRDMTVLELAPTITCVVLAGKVGSNIAGGLGTMRITEQVDALEVMGINSASYLILPKIIAAILTFPLLVIMAAFLSIYGGYLAGVLTGVITEKEYIYGIRYQFSGYNITFAIIKSLVFAFLISSISSYQGFFTKGGALEVGQSSTEAVTNSCIAVLCADYLLAQLLL